MNFISGGSIIQHRGYDQYAKHSGYDAFNQTAVTEKLGLVGTPKMIYLYSHPSPPFPLDPLDLPNLLHLHMPTSFLILI